MIGDLVRNLKLQVSKLSRADFGAKYLAHYRFKATKSSVSDVLRSHSNLRISRSELKNYDEEIKPNTPRKAQRNDLLKIYNPALADHSNHPRSQAIHKTSNSQNNPRHKKRHVNSDDKRQSNVKHKKQTKPGQPVYTRKYEIFFNPTDVDFLQAQKPDTGKIARLAHKLDRVLFSPGVHFLQDPRTRIFNFTPYLKNIVAYENFDFSKVSQFVSASKDKILLQTAEQHNKRFFSSTSSMTSTLIQFYLFLNNYTASKGAQHRFDFPSFTRTVTNLPSSVIVEPKGKNSKTGETIYSVSADKSTDVEILLSAMGHCLETLLTTEENEFRSYLLNSESKPTSESTKASVPNSNETSDNLYNYSAYGGFLMRSQLDCYDPRLPGNGTFDLKTRAACAIRYDKASEASTSTYQIWKVNGNIESFEREYLDLIRTAGLLKYGFQARIGQMDGIFVAYHNIASFFGFQYLPLSEIDKVFYSNNRIEARLENWTDPSTIESNDNLATHVAESQFKVSLNMWENIMNTVIDDLKGTKYENSPFRLVMKRMKKPLIYAPKSPKRTKRLVETRRKTESFMRIYALPISSDDVIKLQSFSSNFQTSFRENISSEERISNLQEKQRKLDELNEELVEKNALLSYNLWATPHIDGNNVGKSEEHAYPSNSESICEWRYVIDRITEQVPENEEAKQSVLSQGTSISKTKYLELMKEITSLLTMAYQERSEQSKKSPDFVANLRKYTEVGRLRLKKWRSSENPPKTY